MIRDKSETAILICSLDSYLMIFIVSGTISDRKNSEFIAFISRAYAYIV